jgi:hypothetical protein
VIGYYPTFTGETPAAFTDAVRLNLQGRGFTTGTGAANTTGTATGGATSGTGTVTDATTVGGLTADQIINRAQQTGPFYCQWYFPNELSGVVWRGSVNGSLWRLKANDEVPAERTLDLEQYAAAAAGDVLLASGLAGVVLYGRDTDQAYRVSVNDADPSAPVFDTRPVTLAQARVDDFVFGASGFGPVVRGRTTGAKYLLCLVDAGGWEELKLELGEW